MIQTLKKSKGVLIYGGSAILLLVAGLIIAFLAGGYTFGPGFSIRPPGKIILIIPEAQTHVFVDDTRVRISSKDNETFTLSNLSDGTHTILVAKDGFLPWGKNVPLREKQNITIYPFLAPATTTVTNIPETDTQYRNLKDKIINSPSGETVKVSGDNRIGIWVSGNNLMAEWRGGNERPRYFCQGSQGICENQIVVISTNSKIKNADFYADRSDVVMISIQGGVYAIELDSIGVQNFQPLYLGTDPQFYKESSQRFFVLDGNSLKEVAF